jgi:hypothetical protein
MPEATAPRADIVYAQTREGYHLPVIDVSHPAFAVPDDPASVEAFRRTLTETDRQRKRMPRFVLNWMLRRMARRSLLARALFSSDAEVLGAVSTYVLKLGAANLAAPFDTPLDRRLAAFPGAMSMRIRLQQLARLLAEGLRPALRARPGVPLRLINVGGGTAIDTLNTLILLRKSDPALLARPITLHVLDPDSAGPEFGRSALGALLERGPLHGLAVEFVHMPYDWKEVSALAELVGQASASNAIIAACSEGALFEYPDDPIVLANLNALRGALAVGGTVTRADPITREFVTTSRFKLVPRGAERFGELAQRAGFALSRSQSALLSDQVLLRPAPAAPSTRV